MRVDLKKFLFFGSATQKDAFFKEAQELGIIHFIPLGTINKSLSLDLTELIGALKILRGLPTDEQEKMEGYSLADSYAKTILDLKKQLDHFEEEKRLLKLEIARVDIFGNFSSDDRTFIKNEGHKVLQFFYAKRNVFDDSNLPEEVIYVGTEHNLDYFVSINETPKQYDRLVEMIVDEPVGVLRKRYQTLSNEGEVVEKRLKGYAKYQLFLQQALIHEMDTYQLHSAKSSVQNELEEDLFAAEGWVPINSLESLYHLADAQDIYLEEIAIEDEDVVPTYLENEGLNRIGEDLVSIYDTPSNKDKDPSLWVLASFSLFFAMILGDAGYGLVFLVTALYIRYRTGAFKGLGNRVWKLFLILSCACIFWGTMSHSFFGIPLSTSNPLRKISLLHWLEAKKADYYLQQNSITYQEWLKVYPRIAEATSGEQVLHYGTTLKNGTPSHEIAGQLADGILLEIALLVGIIHLTLSFLRYIKRTWSGIGWIIFMWGCYLYFPSYLNTESMANYVFGASVEATAKNGLIMIYGGLGLAFLLAFIQDKIWGLLQVMNLIQVSGDVLSYLRLYALGLAGSVVMTTINDFAGAVNIVFGIILFVLGHLINMALGIMGGVIHGLRLNFIEWYHYSFEGNGRKFNPLRKMSDND